MGLFSGFFGKKEDNKETEGAQKEEGKYQDACALCGAPGTDKKWAGKYWHVKCLRKGKKVAKGML